MPVYKEKNRSSWYFKCCINGRQFLRRGFATKNEARQAENDFMYMNRRANKKHYKKTILTWERLVSYYLEWMKGQVKITYYYALKRALSSLLPYLPDIDVEKILYSDFERARNQIENLDISIRSKNRKIKLIRAVFDFGRIYHQISNSEYLKIAIFKDYTIHKKKIKQQVVSFNEFKALYDSANDYYKLVFLTLYTFGIRIGELMGLKVDSFDFKENTMQIYQSISWKTGSGSFVVTTTKTRESDRFFYMPKKYVSMLRQHIEKNQLGMDDYIFFSPRKKSHPISENALRNAYSKLCVKSAFPHGTKFHIFRHTNTSELYAHGVSEEDIKNYEGHSSFAVTERYYLHQTDASKKRTLEVVESILEGL